MMSSYNSIKIALTYSTQVICIQTVNVTKLKNKVIISFIKE